MSLFMDFFSHSSPIKFRNSILLSVSMVFVQTLVCGIENWPWALPLQPSSDITAQYLLLVGSNSWDLEPCGSWRDCCFSASEGSQCHPQTGKLPHVIGKIHGQWFQVIQVAKGVSCGNFAHPVSGWHMKTWRDKWPLKRASNPFPATLHSRGQPCSGNGQPADLPQQGLGPGCNKAHPPFIWQGNQAILWHKSLEFAYFSTHFHMVWDTVDSYLPSL